MTPDWLNGETPCPTCGAEVGYPCGHLIFDEDGEWVEPLAPSPQELADAAYEVYLEAQGY